MFERFSKKMFSLFGLGPGDVPGVQGGSRLVHRAPQGRHGGGPGKADQVQGGPSWGIVSPQKFGLAHFCYGKRMRILTFFTSASFVGLREGHQNTLGGPRDARGGAPTTASGPWEPFSGRPERQTVA